MLLRFWDARAESREVGARSFVPIERSGRSVLIGNVSLTFSTRGWEAGGGMVSDESGLLSGVL